MSKFLPLNSPKAFGVLNSHLSNESYINGIQPTSDDLVVFQAFEVAPEAKWPHICRWYRHINSFSGPVRMAWPTPQNSNETTGSSVPTANGNTDDDFDLFSEQTEQEKEANAARVQSVSQNDNKVVQRSLVILDIKPWDENADWDLIEQHVRSLEIDGLEWKASKLADVAFGIKKLQIVCHIVDDKVSVDSDIIPPIESFEDQIQSVDIFAFNKL